VELIMLLGDNLKERGNIECGGQLGKQTSSTTLDHKLLRRGQLISMQLRNGLTCQLTWSDLDHVLPASC
jgi:hypothetical protein